MRESVSLRDYFDKVTDLHRDLADAKINSVRSIEDRTTMGIGLVLALTVVTLLVKLSGLKEAVAVFAEFVREKMAGMNEVREQLATQKADFPTRSEVDSAVEKATSTARTGQAVTAARVQTLENTGFGVAGTSMGRGQVIGWIITATTFMATVAIIAGFILAHTS